jgi:hypothetical protein
MTLADRHGPVHNPPEQGRCADFPCMDRPRQDDIDRQRAAGTSQQGMRGGTVPQHSTIGGIDVDVLAATPLVRVTGEVDLDMARELRTVLHGLLSMGHAAVDVDLAGVDGLDPCVPQVFAEVWSRGLVLHLRNPSPAAQELLHLEAS